MLVKPPKKAYRKENNKVFSCQYHIVFCPKYRRHVLVDGISTVLKGFIRDKQVEFGYVLLGVEITDDHVHVVVDIPPTVTIMSIVDKIKDGSARILRSKFPDLKSRIPCMWTKNCFIATVGSSSVKEILAFIELQRKL